MTTIQYIIHIIKRFGLFGKVDVNGLVQEISDYQTRLMNVPEWREHNVQLLNRINQASEVRKVLNTTLDSWVTDLQANPQFTEVDVAANAYDPQRLAQGKIISAAMFEKKPDLPFPESAGSLDTTRHEPMSPIIETLLDEAIQTRIGAPQRSRKPRKPRKPKKDTK